ncbi:recombinase family protein [Sphingomonas nostoxanthinifaciens]|uniref:recombinase family protein n=1 Tax=Sphingomonas nostoxanthinifaciens TaxID=2872652 RepID=UPI001CC1D396|nr:recombinase family protein [Sphingomonas nostoxanthinifaciens]UAK23079.1 recombinase family protein [Sphingomonas nostoxanthinifaciens]
MRDVKAKLRTRCAIYTRKSTEDGLEQEYNSLDAQHDACAAYVLSQRHEGWTLLADRYDDGGFSGGTMERPGLQRLLGDIAGGKVDTIIIYKVDRLTRSLADFAKIVDVLDRAGASFVSVTQSFNTTTSMGRLTLNMLLSFAQFEREVTGERIRDKIAASKRKGLWMGGPVPLGYDVQDRRLVVNEPEAALVRHIYQRYVALPSVKELIVELNQDGHRTKVQLRASGPHKGGVAFRRGTLYHLLANRIYLGDIVHKGNPHRGEHPAIVTQALWDEVRDKLAARGPGSIVKRESRDGRLLVALLYDGLGRAMSTNHATRGSRRYLYYATRNASADQPAWRVGARDLERAVIGRVKELLLDRNRMARAALKVDPRSVDRIVAKAAGLAERERDLVQLLPTIVERIDLAEERVTIRVSEHRLLQAFGMSHHDDQIAIIIDAPVQRIRRGRELRLVFAGEQAAPVRASPDAGLVALLADAIDARMLVLANPTASINQIAATHGRCRKRLTMLLKLSWLAPEIVKAILAGCQPTTVTRSVLTEVDLPIAWAAQRAMLLAA